MTQRVDLSRRNFITARPTRQSLSDSAQSFQLDVAPTCLPYQNVVCEACRDSCEVNAIRFPPRLGGAARPVISADKCTGCGDCVAACPVDAVTVKSLIPDVDGQEVVHGRG